MGQYAIGSCIAWYTKGCAVWQPMGDLCVCVWCVPAAERHEESNRGDLCCLSSSCLSSSLPYKGTKPGTGIVQIHEGAKGLMKCCCCQSSAIRKHSSFPSMCISQQSCIAGTSYTYTFLLYKVIAFLLHPQSRLHQQVPSRIDLRGWLLMACGIRHVTAESYHHTMQGGAVTCTMDVLRSAGICTRMASVTKSEASCADQDN